jgi:hypothetical protein
VLNDTTLHLPVDDLRLVGGTMNLRRGALIVGTALAVLVVNVAISVLYMVVYSYLIEPGHDNAFYQAHVQFAAPYSSIVAGMPLMYLAGRWIGRRAPAGSAITSALSVWLIYAVIDLAALIPAATARLVPLVVISLVTKLAASFLGGVAAKRRTANSG